MKQNRTIPKSLLCHQKKVKQINKTKNRKEKENYQKKQTKNLAYN